jgi:hypothetical protein
MDVVARTNAYTFQDQPAHFDLNDASQGEAIPPNTGALPSAAVSVPLSASGTLISQATPSTPARPVPALGSVSDALKKPIPAGQENRPAQPLDSFLVEPPVPAEFRFEDFAKGLVSRWVVATRGAFPAPMTLGPLNMVLGIPPTSQIIGGAMAVIFDINGSPPIYWFALKCLGRDRKTSLRVFSYTPGGEIVSDGEKTPTNSVADAGLGWSTSPTIKDYWLFLNLRAGVRGWEEENKPNVASDGTALTMAGIVGFLARFPYSEKVAQSITQWGLRVGAAGLAAPAWQAKAGGAIAAVIGGFASLFQEGLYVGPAFSGRIDIRQPNNGRNIIENLPNSEFTFSGPGGALTTTLDDMKTTLWGSTARYLGDSLTDNLTKIGLEWDGPTNWGNEVYGDTLGNPKVDSFTDILNTPYFNKGGKNYVHQAKLEFTIDAALDKSILDPFKIVAQSAVFLGNERGSLLERLNARAVMYLNLNQLTPYQALIFTLMREADPKDPLAGKVKFTELLMKNGNPIAIQDIPQLIENLKRLYPEEEFKARIAGLAQTLCNMQYYNNRDYYMGSDILREAMDIEMQNRGLAPKPNLQEIPERPRTNEPRIEQI